MATHKRYAMIDSNSGFVWGVENADTPEQACEQLDANVGEYDRTYAEVPRHEIAGTTATGYLVYRAPDDFHCDDGQDERQIARVEAMAFVAAVACTGAE